MKQDLRAIPLHDPHDNVTWHIARQGNPALEAIETRWAQAYDAELEAAFTYEACAQEVNLPEGFLYGLEL